MGYLGEKFWDMGYEGIKMRDMGYEYTVACYNFCHNVITHAHTRLPKEGEVVKLPGRISRQRWTEIIEISHLQSLCVQNV